MEYVGLQQLKQAIYVGEQQVVITMPELSKRVVCSTA